MRIKLFLTTIFIVFSTTFCSLAADGTEHQRMLKEAQQLQNRGEQAKCLIITNRIIDALGNRDKTRADSVVMMNAEHICGTANISLGNGVRGMSLMKDAAEYAKKLGDSKSLAKIYNSLFSVYYNSLDFKRAQDLMIQAIELSAKNQDTANLVRLYNNKGLLHYALRQYGEALASMRKALSLTSASDGFERSQIYTNMAEVYYKQNRYNETERWLGEALDALKGQKISNKTVQTYLNMALVKAKLGKTVEAKTLSDDIYSVLPSLQLPQKVNSIRQLADISLITGDRQRALDEMLEYDRLADSLQHIDSYSQMQQLLVAYDTERLAQHNDTLRQSLKTKNLIAYGSLAFIVVVVAFSVMLWLHYRNDRRKSRLIAEQKERLLQYEQEEHKRKQKRMSLEIEHKNRQLTSYTIDLAAVNEFHQKVIAELNALNAMVGSRTAELTPDTREEINTQTQKLNSMLAHFNDKPLNEDFRIFFEEVHPDYLKRLSHSYPKLTDNDLRLCAYLYLGMSSKEIAALTYREVRSIESSRNRLRKKLGLEPGADVRAFLTAQDAGFNTMQ